MVFDLEERTLHFSKEIIALSGKIKITMVNKNIISQVLRSSSSIGANYCEAIGGSSKKDFRNKIFICKKESQETRYWLKLLLETEKDFSEEIDGLLKEAHELVLIFQKIGANSK